MGEETQNTTIESEEAKLKRAQECAEKIKSLLENDKCKIIIYVTVGTDGSVKGEYKVVAL